MTPLAYLDHIRTMPCVICGKQADPHHMKNVGMGRDRKKELQEHFTAVPLCRAHHTEYHQSGEDMFRVMHGVDLWKWGLINLSKWICDGENTP